MPTPEKEARVADLEQSIDASSGLYLSEFSGVTVAMMNDLRGRVLDAGGRIEVAKNRLLKLAIAGKQQDGLVEFLNGPTAIIFCAEDPIGPAKAVAEFAKALSRDGQRWEIKAAFIDGRLFAGAEAAALAQLPPIEGIKAAVVGAIAGPTDALVRTLNAVVSDLVFTLQAIADKQGEAAT